MADLSDVETALVTLISAAVYPTGTGNPSAVGAPCRIYRGWPEATALNADLAAGTMNVTVFADPGLTRNTSRYWPVPQQISTVAPTVTVTVSGAVVTIGGTVTAGNVVGIAYGGSAQMTGVAYAALSSDTPATIAAAIAGLTPGAAATGAVVTMPSPLNVTGAVMVPQQASIEVRRQDQGFRISCWCNTPATRDTTAALIDNAIAGLRDANGNLTRFMPILPGASGWIRYLRGYVNDVPTKDTLWRRDLSYMVEYPTTNISVDPAVLFAGVASAMGGGPGRAIGILEPGWFGTLSFGESGF